MCNIEVVLNLIYLRSEVTPDIYIAVEVRKEKES